MQFWLRTGGWVSSNVFQIVWASQVCKILFFLDFHYLRFSTEQTLGQLQVKSQSCLHHLAGTAYVSHTNLCAYWHFSTYTFKGLCKGWMVQNMQDSVARLHMAVHTQRPTQPLHIETQVWGSGSVDRQINVNLCGSLVVQSLNNQIPSAHSTNWIAYDKITAFSPTLFNLHFEKNWKWHGKVRPININNCSLFASTVLQRAVW